MITYFLTEADLSFANFVKRNSFYDLLQILNEGATPLINNTCKDGIAAHLERVFLQSQEKIKLKILAKPDSLAFTTDSWTDPNVTAFMAVTVHYINESFEMKDLTLALPHITGA